MKMLGGALAYFPHTSDIIVGAGIAIRFKTVAQTGK
jgi:hypothetical protein